MSNYDVAANYYQNILFRPGSQAEIQSWATILDKGQPLDDVRNEFLNSQEAINNVDPLIRLYQGAFDRQPEKSGLAFHVNEIQSGKSFASIANEFVSSPEFQADHAGQNFNEIITSFYQNLLGRNPEDGAFNYYAGLSVGQSLAIIANSQEAVAYNDLGQERVLERFANGQDSEAAPLNNTPTPPETVTVIKEVPGPTVYVPTPVEPEHVLTRSVDATLDFTSTKNFAGTEINVGNGNGANNYSIVKDVTAGVELGLKVHYRTGNDITSSSVDADGTVRYNADSGFQDGRNNENGVNMNRSAVSFDFSINTGVNNIGQDGKVYQLAIDTDPSAAQSLQVLTLQNISPGVNIFVNSAGTPVIGDEDGNNPHISQNSVNFGFGFLNNNIVGGPNMPSGDLKAGTYDVYLRELNNDGTKVYAENHIVLQLSDPQVVALKAIEADWHLT